MKKSDCKFFIILEICFESIENSETNAISEKKLIKTAWVIIFEKLEKLIRFYWNKN